MAKTMILAFSILLLLAWVQEQGVDARHCIVWDDFRVHEYRLASKGDGGGRVIVVDQNGNGDSTTVQGAVDMVPDGNNERVKIYIHPGIYRERVHISRSKPFISLIGKPKITSNATNQTVSALQITFPIITNNIKASDREGPYGVEVGTAYTATVWVESDFFCATAITFENSIAQVGNGYQAVALRVDSDRAMFYRVRMVGQQDTLLDNTGTHYFYKCHIQGSVDFVCGQAKSLFQECTLYSIAENAGAIAAHHRSSPKDDTGFSFFNCTIKGTGNIYLGRAWGEYSRIVYSYCNIDDIIIPPGWSDWDIQSRQETVVFGEYQCKGTGSNRTRRAPWSKSLSDEEAMPYLSTSYIHGRHWLRL